MSLDVLRERLLRHIQGLPAEALSDAAAKLGCQFGDQNAAKPKAVLNTAPHSKDAHSKDWPHAPVHRISEHGTYIVTGGTMYKEKLFNSTDALSLLESKLLSIAKRYEWQLEAWAVFANHYHFLGHSCGANPHLEEFLNRLHTESASDLNAMEHTVGRRVWFNYWETKITFEKSYFTRLNYVHQNPVKHGLVKVANQYRWCSAGWFERTATNAQVSTIYGFKTDQVRVRDDF